MELVPEDLKNKEVVSAAAEEVPMNDKIALEDTLDPDLRMVQDILRTTRTVTEPVLDGHGGIEFEEHEQ